MSFSRKGCFKCGNIGHIAENCESATRLCYNCRAADHESSQCPHPRTTEAKQCYSCAGVGHVSSNCPSAGMGMGGGGGRACYNCGFPGHIARVCPQGPGGGFGRPAMGGFPRRAFNSSASGAAIGSKCYRCNGDGHFARDCPTPPSLAPAAAARPKACYRCAEVGHLARDCPTLVGGAGVAQADESVVVPVVASVGDATSLVPSAVETHA